MNLRVTSSGSVKYDDVRIPSESESSTGENSFFFKKMSVLLDAKPSDLPLSRLKYG